MPRRARLWAPNEPYHLISRFVDREFRLLDETDREALRRHITLAERRWDWRFFSWADMSTHVHRGVLAGERPPGPFFSSVHTRFAAYHHKRYGTLGPVFASRPKQFRVKRAKIAALAAYHHRNPVEAGVVAKASDSRWTSHRFYLRLEPAPSFLDVAWGLDLMGFDDTEAGRNHFDQFVMDVDLNDLALWAESSETPEVSPVEPSIPDAVWELLLDLIRRKLQLARPLLDQRAKKVLATVLYELTGASAAEIGARVNWSAARVHQVVSRASLDVRMLCDELKRDILQRAA